MAGPEVVIAAAAVSLISSGASAYGQYKMANQSADIQMDQLRQQQVQLRLQQNQASIDRMKKLRSVLATEEVMFGARNIAPGSGSVRAITNEQMSNFYADENAEKLNYGAKALALARQGDLVQIQRKAQVFSAITGFIKEGANTVMAAYSVPSKNLIDSSKSTTNVGGSYGAQNYMAQQRSPFDLNAG